MSTACATAWNLHDLADRLVAAQSSHSLIHQLEGLFAQFGVLPVRLYLHDAAAGCYYAAAGFGCAREAGDIPAEALSGATARRRPLRSNGAPVGLIELLGAAGAERPGMAELEALLGPLLVQLNRQEVTVRELRQAQEQMGHIVTAGQLLHHLDVDVLLTKILETVIGALRAQVGAVLTAEEDDLRPRVVWGLREDHLRCIRVRGGRPVADEVLATGMPLCVDAEGIAARLEVDGLDARLTGLLALPLIARGRNRGVVLLANPDEAFGPAQQRLAATLCSLAAAALDNAMLVQATVEDERLRQELALARSVQLGMYPLTGLACAGLWAEGMSRPCNETGGDYYTFMERGDRLVAVIGDVSGHGLGAALFTTMAHAIIQQQLRAGVDLEEGCLSLNEALTHTQSGRFMTMALIEIDPATRVFTYVSAGHNPLLWIHDGQARWLESCGMPLGIMLDADFPPPPPATLSPGDYLIMYTDGITEADDGQGVCYGEERLAAIGLRGWQRNLRPDRMIELIATDVDAWSLGRPHGDDLTMVVIAVKR